MYHISYSLYEIIFEFITVCKVLYQNCVDLGNHFRTIKRFSHEMTRIEKNDIPIIDLNFSKIVSQIDS